MASDSIILLASGRQNGNTTQLASEYSKLTSSKLINLNDYTLNHFNYAEQNDDFNSLVSEVIQYKTIILASPVYWYSVSSLMKTFIDRITELLIFNKELGRQLRGKNGILLATGASEEPEACFDEQIKLSFNYLGINYKGMLYCYCEDSFNLSSHQNSINQFIKAN